MKWGGGGRRSEKYGCLFIIVRVYTLGSTSMDALRRPVPEEGNVTSVYTHLAVFH